MSLQTDESKQILSAISQETEARQVPIRNPAKPVNTTLTQAHEVSSILHSLIKEGTLRNNISKLSVLSWEMVKGEASFEQRSYELQILRKTYSESALREGIQRSLKGLQQTQSTIWALVPPWTPSLRNFPLFMGKSSHLAY